MGDMSNLRTWLVVSIFLLGLVTGQVFADPNLIAHYTFDDGDANDSSGNNHHGTLTAGDATTSVSIVYDADRDSNVLELNNPAGHTINSVVDCGGAGDWADIRTRISIAAWLKVDTFHVDNQYLLAKGNTYQLTRSDTTNAMRTYMQLDVTALSSSTIVDDGSWHHIAVTYDSDSSERIIYIDGEDSGSDTPSGLLNVHIESFVIGGRLNSSYDHRGWDGRVDDVRLHDRILSPGEIRLLAHLYKAWQPEPENGAEGIDVNVDIQWTAGNPWVTHSVYLSSNWNDVNERQLSAREATGLTDPNWRPGDLLADTLYYWCVDETDSNGTYAGDIWQFETESTKATSPHPVDGAIYLPLEPVLSWSPGCSAADYNGHDVYFGTDYAAVADANHNSDEFLGNFDVNSCSPDCLKAKTTYYWAVDEINGPNTWPGDIWSFTTGTEGYYKDILVDAGIYIADRPSYLLPAVDYLGVANEYLLLARNDPTEEDYAIQNKVFIGDANDNNGRLLYPDGEPRFRLLYVNGGSSTSHGGSLSENGRQRMRDFYYNGGSYSGSCAGAFLCSTGTTSVPVKEEYLHIWPARCMSKSLTAYVGMDIPSNSALLDYYDFGGDLYISEVRHHGGPCADENNSIYWAEGTEILSIFDYPPHDYHNKVNTWAYKKDANSGRLAVIASHPEIVTDGMPTDTAESVSYGEQRDYTAAVWQYAMDGLGDPAVKAALQNGVIRVMNDNSTTGYEKIGDKQYHHFTIQIPSGMKLTITLDGLDDVNDLDLFARKDDFALRGESGLYETGNTSSPDETLTINDPCAGTWYIGVKGVNTVSTTLMSWGQDYTGNLGLLNGVAYTITAEWHMLGDFNGGNDVDSVDFSVLALTWQKAQGQAGYDPNCDISIPADDIIDEKDIKIFTDYWLAGK